jgi:hypothetical protein
MALSSSSSSTGLPTELLNPAEDEAARDADLVGKFLAALGFNTNGDRIHRPQLRLPEWFLLELGATLRLVIWEHSGIQLHREAGLPTAQELLRGIFLRLMSPPGRAGTMQDTPLTARVARFFVDNFAWSGRRDLNADVLLGDADEDGLVDMLASLIWTYRDALCPPPQGTGRGKS